MHKRIRQIFKIKRKDIVKKEKAEAVSADDSGDKILPCKHH